MLRWCESWSMSGNINDYTSYDRVLVCLNPFNCISIGRGGVFNDPFVQLSNYAGNTANFVTRVIPGGPFQALGHSFRISMNASPADLAVGAFDVVNNLTHCSVHFNGFNGIISIQNASGTIFTSAPGQFPSNGMFWCEILFTIGTGTTGAVEIKLPSTSINVTGINTQNGTRPYCDTTIWWNQNGSLSQIQHMLWWDTTGTYNNTWMGDRRVIGELPNANGDTDQFTPIGLASNYLNVANIPPNGADYNVNGVVGDLDLYKISAPSGITAVAGVMVSIISTKDDAGTRSAATQLKSNTTLVSGVSVPCASSYLSQSDVWEVDPATSAPFTPAALALVQIGAKVSA